MKIAEIVRPIELPGVDTFGDFEREVQRGQLIMFGYFFMVANDSRYGTFVVRFHFLGIDKGHQDDIDLGIEPPGLPDDPFHPANLLDIGPAVGRIIDGGFLEKQIDRAVFKHIPREAKGPRRRTGRRYPGGDKVEFGLWKALLQVLTHHVSPAGIVGNGAAQERDPAFLVPLEFDAGIRQAVPQIEMEFVVIGSRMGQDEIDNGLRIFEAMRMMVHARLANDGDLAAEFLIASFDNIRVLRHRNGSVGSSTNVQNGYDGTS